MTIIRPVPALAALLVLSGCSSQKDKELAAVKSARSVAAEWAMAERLSAGDRLTAVYASQIRTQAKDQLRSAQASLRPPNSPAARAIGGILAAPSPSASQLEAAGRALEQAEKPLEAR